MTEVHCLYCGEDLAEKESPYTDADGDLMCDSCYDDTYRDVCSLCQEGVENTQLESKPGELIAIWEDAPSNDQDLAPGYYRVKAWPFFFASVVGCGWFRSSELEKVADLDDEGKLAAKESFYTSSPLCCTCRKRIEKSLTP